MMLASLPVRTAGLSAAAARLVDACPPALRPRVRAVLTSPRLGGRGLRLWVLRVEQCDAPLPDEVPLAVLQIYLDDPDAEPLWECADCGLALPVRAGRRAGYEPTCDRVYFHRCPCCTGVAGEHAYAARAR